MKQNESPSIFPKQARDLRVLRGGGVIACVGGRTARRAEAKCCDDAERLAVKHATHVRPTLTLEYDDTEVYGQPRL